MGVVIVSPLTGLCQENCPLSYVNLVRATYCTEYGPGYHRIGSIYAVIWQAGTNWAGPVRIYYGPEWITHLFLELDSKVYITSQKCILMSRMRFLKSFIPTSLKPNFVDFWLFKLCNFVRSKS